MDLDLSIFKKAKTKTENISSQESFNIGDTLRARYNSGESITFYSNFVHDRDFDIILNDHLKNIKKQIKKLEKMAQKYKLKTPASPSLEINISADLDQVTDKFLFRKIYGDFIHELYSLSRSVITSTLNDKVRETFIEFTIVHLQDFQRFYKYGKLKGWTEIAPAYKTYKEEEKEQLSDNEAVNLWDHLNVRYDHLELHKIYSQFVHDPDFKMILDRGQTILEDQLKILEKKCSKYEVPVPEKPPAVQKASVDPEIITDKFAYRHIFKGMQEAVDLHIRAVIETTRNDSMRDMFMKFLEKEISLYNKIIKYGKAKGWTHVVPKKSL